MSGFTAEEWGGSSGTTFKKTLPSEGQHIARCCSAILLGSIKTNFKNEDGSDKYQMTLSLGFVIEETKQITPKNEEPYEVNHIISKKFNLSMNEKANLRKFIEAWFRKMSDEEADRFDYAKLIGKPAYIKIEHNKDKEYANITGIFPPPKGTKVFERDQSIEHLFYFTDPFDHKAFDKLPEGIKKVIASTPEYDKYANDGMAEQSTPPPQEDDGIDDLPF